MRLVIDCFKLVDGKGKSLGIYNVAKTLIRYLGEENIRTGETQEIIVFGNSFNRRDMAAQGVTFVEIDIDPNRRLNQVKWELFDVVSWARRYKADRILFPRGYRPLVCHIKDTILIHDLIPFYYDKHFPGVLNRVENAYIMNRLKASIKGADRIITISDHSCREIEELVPSSKERICRIYNGLNDVPKLEGSVDKKDRIFAIASPLPHKNVIGVIKAYEAYYQKRSEENKPAYALTLRGISSTESYVEEGILSEEAAAHITCVEHVKEYADLCRMIAESKVFLFLSLAEGFGFPPLEAMQLGTAVVCSDRTSLPEVVGDAALLADPEEPQQAADAIILLQESETLSRECVAKGFENTKRFTWETRTKAYWQELFQ